MGGLGGLECISGCPVGRSGRKENHKQRTMKKIEIMPALEAGQILGIAEYRSSKPEERSFVDEAKGGRVRLSVCVTHSLEIGDSQLAVVEWLPDGTKLADVKGPPFKKGDRVLVRVALRRDKSKTLATVTLEPLAA